MNGFTWRMVDGWLSGPEGDALAALAWDADVLELGTYKGRSTLAMAEAAKRIVCVDWFKGDVHIGPADTFGEFCRNVKAAGVDAIVTPIVSRIEDVDFTPFEGKFDLVFFDSEHTPEAAERDARIALRCVRPGGVIAWHDAGQPGVDQGVAAAGLRPERQEMSLAWCVWEPKGD